MVEKGVTRRKYIASIGGALAIGAAAGFGGGWIAKPVPTAPEVPEKIQIKFLDCEVVAPCQAEAIKEFEVENPNTEVIYEAVPFGESRDKYLTLIEAGTPPDIGYVMPNLTPEFEAKGALLPLDDFMTESLEMMFVSEGVLKAAYFKGHYWGLPIAHSVRLLYYRKDWFEEKGIDPYFKTVPDLIEAAKQVHEPDKGRYGFTFPASSENTVVVNRMWEQFLWAAGGEEFSEDGSKCLVNSSEGVQAMEWIKELSNYFQPGATGSGEGDTERDFCTGRAAMVVLYPGVGVKAEKGEIPLTLEQVGINSNMMPVPLNITDVLMVFKASKYPEVAFRFGVFLQRLKWRMAIDVPWGFLPITKEQAAHPYYAEDPVYSEFSKAEPRSKPSPISPVFPILCAEMTTAIQKVILGESEPKDALDKVAEAVNAELAKVS